MKRVSPIFSQPSFPPPPNFSPCCPPSFLFCAPWQRNYKVRAACTFSAFQKAKLSDKSEGEREWKVCQIACVSGWQREGEGGGRGGEGESKKWKPRWMKRIEWKWQSQPKGHKRKRGKMRNSVAGPSFGKHWWEKGKRKVRERVREKGSVKVEEFPYLCQA